jgi:hypothetical protein
MAFQNSNVQNSYDRMMAGNTEKSSPIQYSQPLRSLRQGGDTTTINTIGNLTPEQRIQTMASRLYEKNQAGVVAGQQIAKSAYDRMFDPRTGAAQGAAEPNYRYAMSQSNQYEPRAGSYEQEIWGKLGRNIAQNNAARAAYDTGDRSYYNKALAASNRNNLGYKNSYFGQ